MCGILGQVNRKDPIDERIFRSMLSTLEKRGPDQAGIFFGGNIALGHRRLAVIDTGENAKQPMASEDGKVRLIFNGEIYNYREIKAELKGKHNWKSQADSEVLLYAYKEWGMEKLLEKIEGMFALAILDKDRNKIFLFRDHFGEKPLYYFHKDDIFCFASELKVFGKNPRIKKELEIDNLSLAEYLVFGYIPSPDSIFRQVKKMEPAGYLVFDLESFKVEKKGIFWHLEDASIKSSLDEAEIIKKTENLLRKSVRKRTVSDVPLGVFLSGGVDSGLTAKYLSEFSKVDSFSLGYENYLDSNELEYSRFAARQLGIKNYEFFLDGEKVRKNFIGMCDYLDEPLADAALAPLYFLSKTVKKKITVALGGDGGDEIFGGYPKYRAQYFIEKYRWLSFPAGIAKQFFSKNSWQYRFFAGFGSDFHQRQFIFGSGGFLPEEALAMIKNKNFNQEDIFSQAKKYYEIYQSKDIINRSLFLDCKVQIPDGYMAKADRATMANSLEMRSPFLDKNLAEFAFSLPGDYKIRNGQGKWILKKLVEKYFGKNFAYRGKRGFGVPLSGWINKELKEVFEEYLLLPNEYLDENFVRILYKEHKNKRADHSFRLLRIFMFNYWLSRNR